MQKRLNLKKNYYSHLDKKARCVAGKLACNKKGVTELLIDDIIELYVSAKVEEDFHNKSFDSAYYNPITSELEFLIARILYHYSAIKELGWKVYLRKQYKKTVPDVRVDKNGKTIALIEIKAAIGFMQAVFSKKQYEKDLKSYKAGERKYDPKTGVKEFKAQIKKHLKAHDILKDAFFLFLPSLAHAHRKFYGLPVQDYEKWFAKCSGLAPANFILLSRNLEFYPSNNSTERTLYKPTSKFERMIRKIEKIEIVK